MTPFCHPPPLFHEALPSNPKMIELLLTCKFFTLLHHFRRVEFLSPLPPFVFRLPRTSPKSSLNHWPQISKASFAPFFCYSTFFFELFTSPYGSAFFGGRLSQIFFLLFGGESRHFLPCFIVSGKDVFSGHLSLCFHASFYIPVFFRFFTTWPSELSSSAISFGFFCFPPTFPRGEVICDS